MPINFSGGIITYDAPSKQQLGLDTFSFADVDWSIHDRDNVLKQVKFSVNPTTTGAGSVTIVVDVDSTDSTINLGSISSSNSFTIMQPDFGTSPTATSPTDTLTFTSSNGSIDITGNSGTKTLNFALDSKIPTEKFELEAFLSFANPSYYKKFTYTGADLTKIELFDTPSMTTLLFQKDFTYSGGDLTTLLTTRVSPSNTLTKTFAYSGGDLANITVVYV